MQLISIITVAILTLGVTSHPGLEARNKQPPSCSGGQVYNCAHNQCVCPPKQYWDTSKSKCCYPPMPMPNCPSGQQPWCSQDKDKSCKYGMYRSTPPTDFDLCWQGFSVVDSKNDYCQDTGYGSTSCQSPPSYPPTPMCPDKQKYCSSKKMCECPEPMYWDEGKKMCKYQPIPMPSCPPLQMPYCGKSKEMWCPYGEYIWYYCFWEYRLMDCRFQER